MDHLYIDPLLLLASRPFRLRLFPWHGLDHRQSLSLSCNVSFFTCFLSISLCMCKYVYMWMCIEFYGWWLCMVFVFYYIQLGLGFVLVSFFKKIIWCNIDKTHVVNFCFEGRVMWFVWWVVLEKGAFCWIWINLMGFVNSDFWFSGDSALRMRLCTWTFVLRIQFNVRLCLVAEKM